MGPMSSSVPHVSCRCSCRTTCVWYSTNSVLILTMKTCPSLLCVGHLKYQKLLWCDHTGDSCTLIGTDQYLTHRQEQFEKIWNVHLPHHILVRPLLLLQNGTVVPPRPSLGSRPECCCVLIISTTYTVFNMIVL